MGHPANVLDFQKVHDVRPELRGYFGLLRRVCKNAAPSFSSLSFRVPYFAPHVLRLRRGPMYANSSVEKQRNKQRFV